MLSLSIHIFPFKSKDIRARIMTCGIESHHFSLNLSQIQIRNEELLTIEHRIKHIPRVRAYNRTASALNPLAVTGPQCDAIITLVRPILNRHHQTHRQNETSAFEVVGSAG